MTDGAFSWLCFHGAAYAMSGEIPKRGEMRLSGEYACYRVYRCADDRYVTVGALEPQFWAALCNALGAPELIERQFVEPPEQDEVVEQISKILASKTRDEWVAELSDLEACFGPVADVAEAFEDPQLKARGMVTTVPTPAGAVAAIGNPVRLVGAERTDYEGAPGFGEHTEAILRSVGYTAQDTATLREINAI
jgi:crotonobetainyl-CoA:carnitine CoA-transferase CaiB-like acyl-CoA transferase